MQIITSVEARRVFAGVGQFSVGVEAPPGRLPRRARRGGAARAVLVVGVGLGLLGAIWTLSVRLQGGEAEPAPVAVEPAPSPQWLDVNRPLHLFELSGSEFGHLPLAYSARRRAPTGERQDFLSYGQFGPASPYFSLAVMRRGEPALDAPDLFVAMVRLAGEGGLVVVHDTPPTLLPSRFGPFETTDLTLSGAGATLACLGFRLQPQTPAQPVAIAGLACRPTGHGMDRAMLTCVLDRIDLVSAGDDAALQAFFVEAERRRGSSCGPSQLTSAGSRTLWLDSEAVPPAMRHLPGSRVR